MSSEPPLTPSRIGTVRCTRADEAVEFILDDGRVVVVEPHVLRASAFRMLRVGQRVRLTLDGGTVSAITMPSENAEGARRSGPLLTA